MKKFNLLLLSFLMLMALNPSTARPRIVEISGTPDEIELTEENPTATVEYTIEADRIPRRLLARIQEAGGVPISLNFARRKNRQAGFSTVPRTGFIRLHEDGSFGTQEFLIFADEDNQ